MVIPNSMPPWTPLAFAACCIFASAHNAITQKFGGSPHCQRGNEKSTPGAVGQKRQIDFALSLEDRNADCRTSGRCWFRPARRMGVVASPGTLRHRKGLHGWVTIFYSQGSEPELARVADRYKLAVYGNAPVRTSSFLRQDMRGAAFIYPSRPPVATQGVNQMIWGWSAGDAKLCTPFQSFFVGTREQYRHRPPNPSLKNLNFDCSKLLKEKDG